MKCLKNCKASVMAKTCGKKVSDEAAEFARAVVMEGFECHVKERSQLHVHVTRGLSRAHT